MRLRTVVAGVLATISIASAAAAADFNVVNSGTAAYVINGVSNPTLHLVRGHSYDFSIVATGHPFWIKSVQGPGNLNSFDDGVTGQATQNGDLTFDVPMSAPSTLFYNCQFHSTMTGTIQITSPVPAIGPWIIGLLGLTLLGLAAWVLRSRRTLLRG